MFGKKTKSDENKISRFSALRAHRKAQSKQETFGGNLWKNSAAELGLFCIFSIYIELVLHIFIFKSVDAGCFYAVLFALLLGAGLTVLGLLMPAIGRRILLMVVTIVETVLAETQLVYHAIFGSLMSMNQVGMGGAVFTNFGGQILYGISQNLLPLILLLLPLLAVIIMQAFHVYPRWRVHWKQRGAALLMFVFIALATAVLLLAGRGDTFSVYAILNNVNTSTETSYNAVGMLATTEQELRYMFLREVDEVNFMGGGGINSASSNTAFNSKNYNVMDIDFEQLKTTTDDELLISLDEYFGKITPTPKNDYTGMLKGYNLITICAESYCPYFVSEELTPALYKLSNSGFIFENFYGSYQRVTTNGEYTMCMGLFPDLSRSKTQSSFDVASNNYLPFCLGNALGNLDYSCWAYHNYIGDFYNRNLTHPNMGYIFQSADDGLDITIDWPSSDLDMMVESVDDYIESGKPFHAYYMTFSGHYQYNWENAMSAKNREVVESMNYSENVKAYIACNLELEYALEYLLQRLDEAGIADRTAIVLTNDHYPYGLSEEEYNELAGQELDQTFEKYRNSFICYVPGLLQDVHVTDYCSTADILPTLLNLFGVEYDSRLLAGTDVLSNSTHVAVLADGSFLTKDFRFDSGNEEIIVSEGCEEPTEETISRYRTYVNNKFAISTNILNSNYYSHIFGLGNGGNGIEDTVVFTDIRNIFNQAAVLYMYRNGYVDPEDESTFGGSKAARIGEFVDVLYRIAGCPETDASSLPEDYAGKSFDEEYEYYDAVCWAFQEGILRPEDKSIKWSRNVYYKTAAVLITRFAGYCGVNTAVRSEQFDQLAEEHPRLTEEEIYALLWVDQAGITNRDSTLEELFGNASNHLSRYQMTSFLFYLCTYELNLNE